MKRISIVIPCYNNFSLMENCLKSLENQSVKDFEVIIVDDCSTDESYKQLLDYAKESILDLYIKKTIKNLGPGGARNLGIEESNGKYIMMLDSDDYIEYNTIELLNKIIDEKKVDCIFFDYYLESSSKICKRSTMPGFSEGYVERSDALIFSNGAAWGKIYLLDIIKNNDIYYPDLIRNEDMPFNKIAISNCRKFFYLKSYLYHYVMNENSLMHDNKLLNENNAIKAFEYIKSNIDNNFQYELEAIFIKEYLYSTTMTLVKKGCSSTKIKEHIIKEEKLYPNWFSNKSILKYPIYMKVCLHLIKYKNIFLLKIAGKIKNKLKNKGW